MANTTRSEAHGAAWVAVILAAGFAGGFLCFCVAVLWDALFARDAGLSSNATQILESWGSGMIGVLGAYVGYRAASNLKHTDTKEDTTWSTTPPATPTTTETTSTSPSHLST